MTSFLGIDIAKLSFQVALKITAEKNVKFKSFKNNKIGFNSLLEWLGKHEVSALYACMEATGSYGEDLAIFLYEQTFCVSVVNPSQIKGFGQSELTRTKTDKADAALILRFCEAIKPALWKPAPNTRVFKMIFSLGSFYV
jgi:transposase